MKLQLGRVLIANRVDKTISKTKKKKDYKIHVVMDIQTKTRHDILGE